jgi:hypothetical protein
MRLLLRTNCIARWLSAIESLLSVLQPLQWCSCQTFISSDYIPCRGPGSVVGMAIGYGLDGSGIKSRWGARFSAPVQTGSGAQPDSRKRGTWSFPGVKSCRDVKPTPHSLLVPWSPYGPYGLCRASVPVQGCNLPFCLYIPCHLYVSITGSPRRMNRIRSEYLVPSRIRRKLQILHEVEYAPSNRPRWIQTRSLSVAK